MDELLSQLQALKESLEPDRPEDRQESLASARQATYDQACESDPEGVAAYEAAIESCINKGRRI